MPVSLLRRTEYDREITRLAVPALGQLGAEPLYVVVDTAVVGHLGTGQLGGLAVAGTLLTTMFWLFNFLAYGTTSAVARLFGAGDRRAAAEQGVHAMALAIGLGVVLAFAGLALAPVGVDLMGASAAVEPYALSYFRISLIGIPAVLIALAGMGYYRGLQDSTTPLQVAVVANVANLLLELVLIYGLDWGVEGSAIATVIAQWGAAIVYLRVVARDARAEGVGLQVYGAHLRDLALVGRDLFVRTGALLLALGLATAVAARLSDESLGAHQIAFQVWIFLALALDAIAIAAQAMVGRYLGAGDAAAARAASARMLEWGLAVGAGFAVLILLLRPVLPDLFTSDAEVIAQAERVLWLVALLQPLNAAVFVLDGILIGAGDFRFLAIAMVVAAVTIFVPLATGVLAAGLGLRALWGALGVLMAARLLANWNRYSGEAWMVVGRARTRG